jgi:23S rRNA-/tRNA-specific pseudouridylate synthase
MVSMTTRKTESRIGPDEEGLSLIDYLVKRFRYYGAEGWLGCIGAGLVRVGNEPCPPDRRLTRGDLVSFDSSGIAEPEVDPSYSVLAEDEDFLLVDKSGFLPVHPGGPFFENTLWFLLRGIHPEASIATRLDRETSGIVLACKGPLAMAEAQRAMSDGRLVKDYLALVHGSFPESAEASGRLIRDERSSVRKKRRFVAESASPSPPAGQSCGTRFELVSRMDAAYGRVSLVRAIPSTGRNHQIRASLLALGYPIVGDKLYGLDEGIYARFASGAMTEADRARLVFRGQCLHCSRLGIKTRAGTMLVASSRPSWAAVFDAV